MHIVKVMGSYYPDQLAYWAVDMGENQLNPYDRRDVAPINSSRLGRNLPLRMWIVSVGAGRIERPDPEEIPEVVLQCAMAIYLKGDKQCAK